MEINLKGVRNAEFLLSEAGGQRSRELVVLPAGQGMLPAGALLKADNTAAEDGAEAVKVLYGAVDTGEPGTELPSKGTAVVRDAEVFGEMLSYGDATDDQKLLSALSLAESGIIVRWTKKPVASNTADNMKFSSAPAAGTAGVVVDPVVAKIKDIFGGLVTGSAASVTLAKATGPGNVVGGGAKAAVNGVVTWDAVTFSAAGDYTLKITAAGLGEAITETITIAAAGGA